MPKRPFILVLDDDIEILEMLQAALSDKYPVWAEQDLLDVVGVLQIKKPDLLISDLGLPILDGITLIKSIRLEPAFAKLPILVISAYPERMVQIPEGLVQGFLAKPFSIQVLRERVAELLKASGPENPTEVSDSTRL